MRVAHKCVGYTKVWDHQYANWFLYRLEGEYTRL